MPHKDTNTKLNVTGSKPEIIDKLIEKLPLWLEIHSICKFDKEVAFADEMSNHAASFLSFC